MKLSNIKVIKGTIRVLTGLHIGCGDNEMHIGGTDHPVVKHPHTNEPYIPGSSIKGKVRSLLELKSGKVVESGGKPFSAKFANEQKDPYVMNIVKLFGSGASDTTDEIGPTRASFSDCFLTEDSKRRFFQNGLPLTEVKSENSINRITGTAENPRFIERVPSGLEFEFSVSLKVFDISENEEPELRELLFKGLKLLELDALGGNGSRGYGRVEFKLNLDEDLEQKWNDTKAF